MAFDVLSLDGEPSTPLPYRERRALLAGLCLAGPTWRAPARFDEPAPLIAATREQGLEGVVAKRLDSPYKPGERSSAWIKHKHLRTERLTVIGHARSASRGARLLVASSGAGGLRYRGVVELGLGRDELWEALRELERPGCPLDWSARRAGSRGSGRRSTSRSPATAAAARCARRPCGRSTQGARPSARQLSFAPAL